MKILFTLIKDEMCVCDIAELLEMSQSAISHQLRVLKQTRLCDIDVREKQSIIQFPMNTSLSYSIWVSSISASKESDLFFIV